MARELEQAQGIRCETVPADLSQPHAGRAVLAEVSRRGIAVEILVDNTGCGLVSSVEESDGVRDLELIQVTIAGLTELMRLAARAMVQRGHGGIINIGSIVSFSAHGLHGRLLVEQGMRAAFQRGAVGGNAALWSHGNDAPSGNEVHRCV